MSRDNTLHFRKNGVLLSDEVLFYLKLEAKRLVNNTDASVTYDSVAECIIRERLTTDNPEWVLAHEEHQAVKQQSAKKHKEIDERALGVQTEEQQ